MITFLGDVALIPNNYKCDYVPQTPFIFNLEYVIGDSTKLKPTLNKVNLISKNNDFEIYFSKKPVAVTIANNHIMDYGYEGLLSTKKELNDNKIDIIEAQPFWYNNKICMLAFDYTNKNSKEQKELDFSKEKFKKQIEDAVGKGAERIIVFMHWGIENQPYASNSQIELGHWLIDEGASIVIGNHPHCIQPIEIYKGRAICYSIGNFMFPNHHIDSHYDEKGMPKRRWHTKWCKWNNESLAIVYDEEKNSIIRIERLFTDKKGVHKKDETTIECLKANKTNKIKYLFRKYALFLHSNFFVEGKLFEISAIKNEFIMKLKGK